MRTRQDPSMRHVTQEGERFFHTVILLWNFYLCCLLYKGDICLDPERPIYMKHVLIELQQENNENKQCIEHEECKHRLIPQFDEVGGDPSLK